MKHLLSLILAVMLVGAVAGTVATGTFAGFSDTEVSTENWMCAGTRILELSGDPLVVEGAWPCEWYEEEFMLINAGTLEGMATIHIPREDGYCGKWEGLECVEDAVGTGVATSESELAAEEGGIVGEDADGNLIYVPGLGADTCDLSKYIDIIIWFDKNGDGDYNDSGELIVEGKLYDIACTEYELGKIPQASKFNYYSRCGWKKTRGWGCYFTYHVNDSGQTMEVPLIAAKTLNIGNVTVWNDENNLYVEYNITASGWGMTEAHVYAGKDSPPSNAPGQFPYKNDNLPKVTHYMETIPLAEIDAEVCNNVYIAAHAVVVKSGYGSYCKCEETAWACGEGRKVKIEMHFPDIDEDDLYLHYFDENIPAEAKWDHWPTNAYMGDRCIFDMVFKFKRPSSCWWW
jgi:predicted ribosomally synthesized peptide with SipW-like signal peptide